MSWVCVSGYFDPFHVGHLEYLKKAKQIGDNLVVIVNSDHQAQLKKGKHFMPAHERCKIIAALKCVDMVVESVDKDRTVCETLRTMEPKPDFFCNGGDQNNNTIPEVSICQQRGIELRDGFGDKIQSSSWLLGTANKPSDEGKILGTTNKPGDEGKILALFDVDGTLTPPRLEISHQMKQFLNRLRSKITIATVGGSDFAKQKEQLGEPQTQFDYVFAENGLTAFHQGVSLNETTMKDHIGEERLRTLIDDLLSYLSEQSVPIKRGTFIEYRNGMLNVSPIGRACSREERNNFEEWDKQTKCRENMVRYFSEKYPELQFSIGGQISFDVFPKGWDKTYCLQFLTGFDEIHFFGDKTYPGGNDHEIFNHESVIGHAVSNPQQTLELCQQLFFK